MSKTALFIRHRAKPGQREQVRRIWDRYVRPRVETNPGHLAYNFCYDDADPDMICVFQLYTDKQAMEAFLKEPWYPEYLREVRRWWSPPRRSARRPSSGTSRPHSKDTPGSEP